jgi:hypothetical protein
MGLLGGDSGLAEAPKRAPPAEEIAFGFYIFERGVKRGLTGFSFGECSDNELERTSGRLLLRKYRTPV